MSLHTLANHLQSAGRGDDKVLVHMTKDEVGGLQSLAKAHGGSLTINPETGLAEAGFLSSLLPTLIGVGLSVASGGALTPLMAAGITGAGYGIATGSLQKGLMAGLGAYGGAGMGQGLIAAGTPVASPAALGEAGAKGMGMANTATVNAGTNSAAAGGVGGLQGYQPGTFANIPGTSVTTGYTPVTHPTLPPPPPAVVPDPYNLRVDTLPNASSLPNGSSSLSPAEFSRVEMRPLTPTTPPPQPPVQTVDAGYKQIADFSKPQVSQYENMPDAIKASTQPPRPMTDFERATKGFQKVTSSGDEAWKFAKDNAMPFISSGLSVAQGMTPEYKEPPKEKSLIRPYDYSYNATGADVEPYSGSGERTYFTPTYTARTPYEAPGPEYAANGGLMGLKYAVGGPVEQMSAQNAIGSNQMYPQSQLQSAMYSNPMVQRPQANNVISSGIDAGVDPYTGEARFASGGATPETKGEYKYDYNPQTQQFTQTAKPTPVNTNTNSQGLVGRAMGMNLTGQPQGGGFTGMMNRAAGNVQQAAPVAKEAPVVTGGIAPPAYQSQQMQSSQPLQRPINIPEYQSPEQQLGLGGFYDYMNQQLGQRYAAGGTTRQAPLNAKMAAVDTLAAKMKTQQGMLETIKAAKAGDYAAMIALQKAGYDMNKLNEYASGGGVSTLGGYSDGGRLLKGPGDGVSDSIPASIGNRQPARLADGEFVVSADVVSGLGNGSTEAGARQLYKMMDRVRKARTGTTKMGKTIKSDKLIPA